MENIFDKPQGKTKTLLELLQEGHPHKGGLKQQAIIEWTATQKRAIEVSQEYLAVMTTKMRH